MIIIFGKNGMKLIKPFVIETDIYGDRSFFEPYMDQMEWTDTNKLYSEHEEYEDTMYGRKMVHHYICLLYTSPSPRDATLSRMPSSA